MSAERVFVNDELRLARSGCDLAWCSNGVSLSGEQPIKHRRQGPTHILAGRGNGSTNLNSLAAEPIPGIHAVASSSPQLLSVAIQFALHLRDTRQCEAAFISSKRVADSPGLIAFPHLVRVEEPPIISWDAVGDHVIPSAVVHPDCTDLVLWELMPEGQLDSFHIDSHVVVWWRERLSDALELRARCRDGSLGPAAADSVADRYMSFKFICEHHQLMRDELGRQVT